jgi:hypothetical protein
VNFVRPLLFAAVLGAVSMLSAADSLSASWFGDLHYNASATFLQTENISRTSHAPTRKNADSYELDVDAGQARQLAASWLLDYSLGVELLDIPDYKLTNTFTGGPHLGVQHKFGLGPLAPVLRFDTAYTYKSARIEANSGWTAEGSVRLSQRLTSYLKLSANGEWLDHYANSSTFDIQQHTFSFEAAWDIDDRWRLTGSVGRLNGRIVANAAPQIWAQAVAGAFGPAIYHYYTSIPSEVTNAYGPGWVAYNVAAHADLWSLALAASLTPHTTLELRTNSVFVVNKVGVRYPNESWGVSLIHRF